MYHCPECDHKSENYKTVHKHFQRSHKDKKYVIGSIKKLDPSQTVQTIPDADLVNSPVNNQDLNSNDDIQVQDDEDTNEKNESQGEEEELLWIGGIQLPTFCNSFHLIKDSNLVEQENERYTSFMVAGSQTENVDNKNLFVLKFCKLEEPLCIENQPSGSTKLLRGLSLDYFAFPHKGSVCRLKTTQVGDIQVVASSSSTGKILLYDINDCYHSLQTNEMCFPPTEPNYIITNHGTDQSYGLDWSPTEKGVLITGDASGRILLTRLTESSCISEEAFYLGHTRCIGELQWSPNEKSYFASCSMDKTIRIWDCRVEKKPVMTVNAHAAAVNAIAWSRIYEYHIASGSDDGEISIWDLRNWSASTATPETIATIHCHQKAIMEMEWSPTEPGILACTSLHDMFTFWDYSEPPIPKKEHEITLRDGKVVHVPGQMQFLDERFEYSQDFHWHPQLPNVIVFYARNMFNFGIKRRQ